MKYNASISSDDKGKLNPLATTERYTIAINENSAIPPTAKSVLRLIWLLSSYANPFIYTLPFLNDKIVLVISKPMNIKSKT